LVANGSVQPNWAADERDNKTKNKRSKRIKQSYINFQEELEFL
jgi:hypothetical protein